MTYSRSGTNPHKRVLLRSNVSTRNLTVAWWILGNGAILANLRRRNQNITLPHLLGCTSQKRLCSFQGCASQWRMRQLWGRKHFIQGCILHPRSCNPMRIMTQLNLLPDIHIRITLKQDWCLINPSHDARFHAWLTLYPLLNHQYDVTCTSFSLTGPCPLLMKKQDSPSNTVNISSIKKLEWIVLQWTCPIVTRRSQGCLWTKQPMRQRFGYF